MTEEIYQLSNCEIMRLDVDDEHYYYGTTSKDSKQYYLSLTRVLDIGAPFPEGLRQYLRMSSFEEQKDRLEYTGARGSKLHHALDDLMHGAELELKEYPTSYEKDAVVTFIRMMRFLAPGKFNTELIVADPDMRVAGTLDFEGWVDEWKLKALLEPLKYLDVDSEGDLQLKEKWLDLPFESGKPIITIRSSDLPPQDFKQEPGAIWHLEGSDDVRWIGSKPKRVHIVIDWKFTGRNAYSHQVQVAAYKTMFNKSRKGHVSRAFTWRYSPRHKAGFDFQESKLDYRSFKRIYDTSLEYLVGFPEPPMIKRYPETVKLYEEVADG